MCRHCKTNRGPPYLRMSLRHVLNFVRNSHIYNIYLQLPLNCWTSFGYVRPSTLVSVLRIWSAFRFFLVLKISVQDAKQKPFSPVVPLLANNRPRPKWRHRGFWALRDVYVPPPQRPRGNGIAWGKHRSWVDWWVKFHEFSAVELIFVFFGLGFFEVLGDGWIIITSNFHWDGKILEI